MKKERITHEEQDEDAWVCICENIPVMDGFAECDEKGNEIEPTWESGLDGLYVCRNCLRIIDQDSLEVVGRVSKRSSKKAVKKVRK